MKPARCASCDAPVAPDALESGAAILLLGKTYCPSCKADAARSVSLDDLAAPDAPPPPRAATPKAPAPKPAEPPARPRPTRAPSLRSAASRPRARSKAPLFAGLAAVAVLAVTALGFALRGGGGSAPAPKPDPAAPAGGNSGPSADPEARARRAFEGVEALLGRADADRVLAAVDAARPACQGTPYAARLDELRAQVLAEREKAQARQAFDPLFEELKKAVAADAEFRRYEELRPKFQKAREAAALASPSAVASLASLQQDYSGRYEKEAQPHYDRIFVAAEQLASERRYDDALRFIDSFPEHLRGSGAWRAIAKLKERVEQDKKRFPKK